MNDDPTQAPEQTAAEPTARPPDDPTTRPPQAVAAWPTVPTSMHVVGYVESREDKVTKAGVKYCKLIVSVPHRNRMGETVTIPFPVTFWENRIPVARQGARVDVEFRVTASRSEGCGPTVRLRGHFCRELAPAPAPECESVKV